MLAAGVGVEEKIIMEATNGKNFQLNLFVEFKMSLSLFNDNDCNGFEYNFAEIQFTYMK